MTPGVHFHTTFVDAVSALSPGHCVAPGPGRSYKQLSVEFDDLLGSRGRHDRSPGRTGSDEGVHFPQLLQKLTQNQDGTNHLRRDDETEIHYC